jgi:cobalamin synthase
MTSSKQTSPPVVNINKNVNWLNLPGVWTWYIALVLLGWLLLSALADDAGLAWTYIHLVHGVVSFYLLHWTKGSPAQEDQGKYDALTFWEQIDDQVYATRTRLFLTAMPIVLYILATHSTDFRKQPLALNLAVVIIVCIAKLPQLHKVRIFGINRY